MVFTCRQANEVGLNTQQSPKSGPRRFYDAAWAEAGESGWQVVLDGRPVRTPQRAHIILPTKPLAEAVAAEWDEQGPEIVPSTMPLTRLANSAIDRAGPQRAEVVRGLVAYGETDLLCYRAEWPQELVARQAQTWDPILAWARRELGAELAVVQGVIPARQPDAAIAALERCVQNHDDFALTAMNQMTTLTASLVLTLAVTRGFLDADGAWGAAHIDEDWQIAQWGEDAAARERREAQWADMNAASRFFTLSRDSR